MDELFPLPDSIGLTLLQVFIHSIGVWKSEERCELVLAFELEREALRLQQLVQLFELALVQEQMPQRFNITSAGRCLLPSEIAGTRIIGVNELTAIIKPISEDVIVVHQAMNQGFIRERFGELVRNLWVLSIFVWEDGDPSVQRRRDEKAMLAARRNRRYCGPHGIPVLRPDMNRSVMAAHENSKTVAERIFIINPEVGLANVEPGVPDAWDGLLWNNSEKLSRKVCPVVLPVHNGTRIGNNGQPRPINEIGR